MTSRNTQEAADLQKAAREYAIDHAVGWCLTKTDENGKSLLDPHDDEEAVFQAVLYGAKLMLENPSGGALLHVCNKTAALTKKEIINKACKYLYEWNTSQAKKYGAKATLGCSDFTIDVSDFRKYLEGQK